MHEMRPIHRFDQNPFLDQVFDIGAVDDRIEGKAELVALIAGPAFGRCC